ncbi:hypothetical protein Tco_1540822 [Tanacetum coccineum]
MLDQTFNRLQKLVSHLELLGEKLSQEDVNQKLLRSLSPEWNTHVVVWRNKSELETTSVDDHYNNLKVYEPEVGGMFEFGDSYRAPPEEAAKDKGLTSKGSTSKKKGRTMAITAEDMQKWKNDDKERTTLLLALLDEHQLRFSKYDNAKELWEAILRTFGGNKATKKTKKNQLKQQYGKFKAEGSETLEQTFNRLQAIISHLEFIEVPIEQDELNQKFLTSLALEWLVYTIV